MLKKILDLVGKKTILLDGGMGTELMARGFVQGECPEIWNINKPEIIQSIHKSYFDAGSDAVLTNSFGGSQIKLASYGLGDRCYELNHQAALLANSVKPEGKFVGGSMGPTGKFLQPQGDSTEEELEEAYGLQAQGLSDGNVDFFLIETQYDLNEALCALRAAQKNSRLPVFVTMTFEKFPRGFFTIMGNSVPLCIEKLTKEKVPVIGANCTLDSADMADLIKTMREISPLPLIAQANAGKATLTSQGEVEYEQGLEDYVLFIPQIMKNGASLIGGCCGTGPAHIRRMAGLIGGITS